jgi:hypothetical protein
VDVERILRAVPEIVSTVRFEAVRSPTEKVPVVVRSSSPKLIEPELEVIDPESKDNDPVVYILPDEDTVKFPWLMLRSW